MSMAEVSGVFLQLYFSGLCPCPYVNGSSFGSFSSYSFQTLFMSMSMAKVLGVQHYLLSYILQACVHVNASMIMAIGQ